MFLNSLLCKVTQLCYCHQRVWAQYVCSYFTAWLAKRAGGDAITTVDVPPYMFTSDLSLFPAVLFYTLPPATNVSLAYCVV